MDTHIPKAVADQLREQGVDVVRCEEVGMAQASDLEHLEYAAQEKRVLISHDDDFLRYHKIWQDAGKNHAGIMYVLPRLQGTQNVGKIIAFALDYYHLIENDAGTIEESIENHIFFVS